MRGILRKRSSGWITGGLVGLALLPAWSRGDDNGFLNRLFRLGGNSNAGPPPPRTGGSRSSRGNPASVPDGYESAFGDTGSGSAFIAPRARSPRPTGPVDSGGPITSEGSSTPGPIENNLQPRLNPRLRVTPAVTGSDPLLTRLALGKSNDGAQFGMFLQVFADGTVIDSEGVHHLSPADIRPIAELIQSGEMTRLRGHCGTPSNDFIDYVHFVVFDRRMGRLQAHSFSYGGNPQGCEAGIKRLHSLLENMQVKLSRASTAPTTEAAGTPAPLPIGPGPSGPTSSGAADVIPLTPVEPR